MLLQPISYFSIVHLLFLSFILCVCFYLSQFFLLFAFSSSPSLFQAFPGVLHQPLFCNNFVTAWNITQTTWKTMNLILLSKKLFIYYPYFPLKKLSDKEIMQMTECFFIHSVIWYSPLPKHKLIQVYQYFFQFLICLLFYRFFDKNPVLICVLHFAATNTLRMKHIVEFNILYTLAGDIFRLSARLYIMNIGKLNFSFFLYPHVSSLIIKLSTKTKGLPLWHHFFMRPSICACSPYWF